MFSERLKAARNAKGLTQKEIADHLGINKEAYQHYEYNVRKPPFENIIKLCQLLDVSADWLLGLRDTAGA
jgi:transcriptional regulator with XRE-family HTH domain